MTTKSKKGAVSAGLGAKPVPKPSAQDLSLFGERPTVEGEKEQPSRAPSPQVEKKAKVEKAQITLHIPVAMEKQLRTDYNAQPAGQRGRFSEFVLRRWGVVESED
jgi:hypothetical protein